jgi:transposase
MGENGMKYYIGIDVSKQCLDVDFCGKASSYSNDEIQIKQLILDLQVLQRGDQLALVICEATGGYEQKIVRACHEAKVPIHVAHANKVRHYAKSQGLLAKTDKIDAQVLSDYGCSSKLKADTLLLTENTEKIRELLKRREQLQADKKRENNRLDKITNTDISNSINEHVDWLDKKIKEIEKKLSCLENAEEVKKPYELLTSIPAIGKLTAHYLLSYLPEIGKLSNKALAALVGVAPYNNDSGKNKGKRFIKGGRSCLRQVLYMSAITAIRHHPDLKSFYFRLRDAGKATKVAITAVIRKLVGMANSVMRRQVMWQEKYSVL